MLVSQGIIIKDLLGGGGELTCTPKSTGVQLGQRGTGCSTRTLASAGSNCSNTTKNPKQTTFSMWMFLPFYLPPHPPPIFPTPSSYLFAISFSYFCHLLLLSICPTPYSFALCSSYYLRTPLPI